MADSPELPVVLGSRSPQRRQLLSLLLAEDRFIVSPPRCPDEESFEELSQLAHIKDHLAAIARRKSIDVQEQLRELGITFSAILTADTIIVGFDDAQVPHVLGQPPDNDWQPVVRDWFDQFYLGKTHLALSAVCLRDREARELTELVETGVRMLPADVVRRRGLLDWYLSIGESPGKAGGYAIQGAASLFIDQVRGSLSNVVGLPLGPTLFMLQSLGCL